MQIAHPTLKKLKIECDEGQLTPQNLILITEKKMLGFRLRVQWNKYHYRTEDVIKVVAACPHAIFNFRVVKDDGLITF